MLTRLQTAVRNSPPVPAGRLALLLFLVVFLIPAPSPADGPRSLGQPGYLVIEAARDSAAAFRWDADAAPGFRTLVWDDGRLIIPDSLAVEDIGLRDIGLPCTASMAGSGAGRDLVFRDGIFPVSEPVALTDGVLVLEVTGGELEFRGAMIRYRRVSSAARELKSGLLLLAGMVLLVIVLLRRARIKSNERAGS